METPFFAGHLKGQDFKTSLGPPGCCDLVLTRLASFLYGFIGTGQTMALYLSDVLHSDPSMDPEAGEQLQTRRKQLAGRARRDSGGFI